MDDFHQHGQDTADYYDEKQRRRSLREQEERDAAERFAQAMRPSEPEARRTQSKRPARPLGPVEKVLAWIFGVAILAVVVVVGVFVAGFIHGLERSVEGTAPPPRRTIEAKPSTAEWETVGPEGCSDHCFFNGDCDYLASGGMSVDNCCLPTSSPLGREHVAQCRAEILAEEAERKAAR